MGGLRCRRVIRPALRTVPALFVLLGGCATDLGPPSVPVASVDVSPAVAPLAVATTVQLTATPKDESGAPLAGRQVVWTSSAPATATVTSGGLVAGVKPGSATITATSESRQGTAAVTVTPGPAAVLVFLSAPATAGAGVMIGPALQVAAQDAHGNRTTDFTGAVTVAIASNPGGGSLSGTTTVAAASGVATFADLSIDRSAPGYTLQASAPGLSSALSAPFEIVAGAAVRIEFAVAPGGAPAGAPITPAVRVSARDSQGNLATGFTADVSIALGTNPSSGFLTGTTTVAAVAGTATFSDLSVDIAGTGYTLVASAMGHQDVTSSPFDVYPGAADELTFSIHPVTTIAGVAMQPVEVTALDAQGNTATAFTGSVTLAVGTNPSGGSLSGVTTVDAVAGVATFATLTITAAATGYTLSATASGLSSAGSVAFAITPAAPDHLVFAAHPATTTAGEPLAAIQVLARDAFGNAAPGFTGPVSVAIAAGTGTAGATLTGTTAQAAVNAVATFAGLSIDRSGSGYQLTAAAAGVTPATSAAFAIQPGIATQLAFTLQPSTVTAGTTITPQVEVTARDPLGNTAAGFTGPITLALGTNPAGGALLGRTTVAASSGVASFPDLRLDVAGGGYTLTAAAAGTTGATSTAFDVLTGQADQLVFTMQPATVTAGAAIAPAVEVTVRDSLGNTVTGFTGDVVLTITAGTGASGATLAGTTSVAAIAGSATFSTLSIGLSGLGYQLSATSRGEAGATSDPFDVVPGPATKLLVSAQPTAATAATVFAPAFQVTAQDALGNRAADFTDTVTVTIAINPGGGVLSGTTAGAALSGVATFADLTIDKSGTGYTLVASANPLTAATSEAIDITAGIATQLVFTVQPTNTGAGLPIAPAVAVTARDAHGNRATDFAAAVTVSIGSNPSGGVLSGTRSVPAVAGVASFADLIIDRTGNGYRLTAAAAGLSGGSSSAFNIITGSIVLVGAGDIADCSSSGDEATANLLDNIAGTVFTAGDNAYPDGTTANFSQCYQPSWGRHKARTRPSPGNHDYNTSGAAPYYAYFGSNAGPAGRGYYSYDLGNWHIISLNSNISMTATSPQVTWLVSDLAATTKPCVLAYWHHPRFSSSSNHGNHSETQPLWDALYNARAEIVISGHDHTYERFAPQRPDGTADASRGIREFVVGTGGRDLYNFGTPEPNSQVRYNGSFGVLKLTLGSASYSWQFIPVAGGTFTDSGSGTCR